MSITKSNNEVSQNGVATNPMPLTSIRTITDESADNKPMNAQIISDGVSGGSLSTGNVGEEFGTVLNDGTTPRVLIGYQEDGFGEGKNWGIKVSQDGEDVTTCTDDKLVMSSGFNSFKIVASGTAVIQEAAGVASATVTVTHNLGYKPAVFAFWESSGGDISPLPKIAWNTSTGHVNFSFEVYSITETEVIFGMYYNPGVYSGNPQNIKYYLCRETAS